VFTSSSQGHVFRIRFITPQVMDENGWQHAAGELMVGTTRLCFLVDLTHWNAGAYQQQWRHGMERLAAGATSTALMTAWRGPGDRAHVMWALWRDNDWVYVQEHSVVPSDLETSFNPDDPYSHIGERVPAAESALPISEWHIPADTLGGGPRGHSSSYPGWSI
jgi:hypothetical protein